MKNHESLRGQKLLDAYNYDGYDVLLDIAQLMLSEEANKEAIKYDIWYRFSVASKKCDKKYLTKECIYTQTFSFCISRLKNFYDKYAVKLEEQGKPIPCDFEEYKRVSREYFNWVSEVLAEKGEISREEAFRKMEAMGL